jgi:ribosomal protein L24
VQVLSGPFRGKVGVVQELDGRGAARVILGLLATRVDVKELIAAAEGKDRPALASSHRKPMGVRS